MTDALPVLLVVGAYGGLLVAVALWAERSSGAGRRFAEHRAVYALALAVYCTTWTYYGSVGLAASSGLLFVTIYLGPTLVAFFWWTVIGKLVRIKNRHQVTSLADLLSLRFGRSQAVAALATAGLVAGLVPYIALQLKTMIVTVAMITGRDPAASYAETGRLVGPWLVAMMLVFTIAFGIRRVRPAERHPGVMVAIAVESVVKLAAFLAVGAFVTFGLFDGFGDVFRRAGALREAAPSVAGGAGVATWLAHLLLAAAAFVLLPRQFQVAVVENADEDHLRTASWVFPAYLLAINVFVLPLALGSLVLGHSPAEADTFVLHLPLESGQRLLSWCVFLGGFSAGTGMIVVETMALATMISNHLVLPLVELSPRIAPARRHLLGIRWCAAAAVLCAAFAYERAFGASYGLVSIGLVSFAAVLQLAPAGVAGLYWRGASTAGALAAIAAGLVAWWYTLVLPLFVRAGMAPAALLERGPFGVEALRPEALLGIAHLDPLSHAVLWTMIANVGALVLGSALFPDEGRERARAGRMLAALGGSAALADGAKLQALASAAAKRERLFRLFSRYESEADASALADECLRRVGAPPGADLSALQLAQLEAEAETMLGASIGVAAARAAVQREHIVDRDEARAISESYADLLASLRVSPADLQRKLDYHRERERLLAREAAVEHFLAEVSERLAASLDLDATARTVAHLAVPRLAEASLLSASFEVDVASAWFAHADPAREEAARIGEDEAIALRSWGESAVAGHRHATLAPDGCGGCPAAIRDLVPDTTAVVVPVATGRRRFGTLCLFVRPGAGLRIPDDLPLAEELARRSAMALENALLFRRAHQAVRAREEFLAVASHELKTPLTPLRLTVQSLRRLASRTGAVPRERLEELFGGADRQISRIARLVDDLLDATRLGERRLHVQRKPMDLSATICDVLERYHEQLAQAGCALSVRVAPDVVGSWDRVRIEQVVTNLLTNAMKYAPAAPIEVNLEADDEVARLSVRDHGPGIAPADRDRIFRPYERAVSYEHVSGFGLGLYIVRQIAEAHGGAIRVDSVLGEGSTFTVELPREPRASS